MTAFNILFDTKTSIQLENIKTVDIIVLKMVCLTISILTLFDILSFIIDLYKFIPLTPIASIAGIKSKFWINKSLNTNTNPFEIPRTLTQDDIVYPRQKPLYIIIPNTIGIPYYCCSHKPNYCWKYCRINYSVFY